MLKAELPNLLQPPERWVRNRQSCFTSAGLGGSTKIYPPIVSLLRNSQDSEGPKAQVLPRGAEKPALKQHRRASARPQRAGGRWLAGAEIHQEGPDRPRPGAGSSGLGQHRKTASGECGPAGPVPVNPHGNHPAGQRRRRPRSQFTPATKPHSPAAAAAEVPRKGEARHPQRASQSRRSFINIKATRARRRR